MKNYLLLIMTFCFVISTNAQDKLYVNLWYGKVKNENVENSKFDLKLNPEYLGSILLLYEAPGR